MKTYVFAIEYYAPDSEEGPVSTGSGLYHKMDGKKLFRCEFKNKASEDEVYEYFVKLGKMLLTAPREYLAKNFPNFLRIVGSRQYWYHIFLENTLPQIEEEKEFVYEEVSIEDHLEGGKKKSKGNTLDLNGVDIYLGHDFEKLFSIPDRINYWDTI